jgi:hypothetical protein
MSRKKNDIIFIFKIYFLEKNGAYIPSLVSIMYICKYLKEKHRCYRTWYTSIYNGNTRTNLSPIRRGFAPGFVNHNKGCIRLAAASDKAYQLLPMVGGSLRVLRLLPTQKLVAMI